MKRDAVERDAMMRDAIGRDSPKKNPAAAGFFLRIRITNHESRITPYHTFPALRFCMCVSTPFLPSSVSACQTFWCLRRPALSQLCVGSPM